MATKKKITDKVDKRRRAKVVVGYDASGEPVIRYASGRTAKELEANKQELIRSYVGGREVQRDILASTYILEWYKVRKRPRVSPSTDQNYQTAIKRYILPAIGDKRMAAVTGTDLQALMNSLAGKGKTLVTDVRSVIRNTFKLAAAEGVIDRDVSSAIEAPKVQRQSRRALTAAEEAAVIKVAAEHPYGLMLAILYYTGMRRGEMLGLRWSDIDFSEHVIHIRRDIDYVTNAEGDVKSKCSIRDVPMPEPLERAFRNVPVKGLSYVIQGAHTGEHLPQPTYMRHWKSLMAAVYQADKSIECKDLNAEAAGAPELTGSVLTAHYLRHNYASILYNAGVDVLTAQKYLGHADPATTLRIYTHLAEEREKADREKVLKVFKQ